MSVRLAAAKISCLHSVSHFLHRNLVCSHFLGALPCPALDHLMALGVACFPAGLLQELPPSRFSIGSIMFTVMAEEGIVGGKPVSPLLWVLFIRQA